MIKVVDSVSGQAISIEVCGVPYEWRLRIGKPGKWIPKIGKNRGKEQTGVLFGTETYHPSLRAALKEAQQRISRDLGLPVESQVIEGIEGWNRAIAEEEKLVALTEATHKAVVNFLKTRGRELPETETEEDDDDEEIRDALV